MDRVFYKPRMTSPPSYWVYGGPRDGTGNLKRLDGFRSLQQCEDFIFVDRKNHPSWEYTVWMAPEWQQVEVEE